MSNYDPQLFTTPVRTYSDPIAGAEIVSYLDAVLMPQVIVIPTPPQSAEHAAILSLQAEIVALNDEIKELIV